MAVTTPPAYLQAGTYSAVLDRLYLATQPVTRDFAFLHRARQGFFPSRYPTYTNPSGMDIAVSACSGLVQNIFVTDGGDYRVVAPTSTTVTLAASSPTQNRIDVVGFLVKDNFYDASGLNQVTLAVIQGANSAGAPSAPSLSGFSFIPVVECLVNATNTSPASLTDRRQRTVADGAPLPIANVTERTAIGTPQAGFLIYRIDRNWIEKYDGTAWRLTGVAICSSTADRDSAVTNPQNGDYAFTTDTNTLWVRASGAWTMAPDLPRANIRQTVTQNLTTGVFGAISFQTEDYDLPGTGGHDNVTNNDRYTSPRAGKLTVEGGLAIAANATGVRGSRWTLNGSAIAASCVMLPACGGGVATRVPAASKGIAVAAGDIVRLEGFQDSGGTLATLSSAENACWAHFVFEPGS